MYAREGKGKKSRGCRSRVFGILTRCGLFHRAVAVCAVTVDAFADRDRGGPPKRRTLSVPKQCFKRVYVNRLRIMTINICTCNKQLQNRERALTMIRSDAGPQRSNLMGNRDWYWIACLRALLLLCEYPAAAIWRILFAKGRRF